MNFNKILSSCHNKSSIVYFVGSPSIAEVVDQVCTKYKLAFVRDYTNSLLPKSDKETSVAYLSITFKVLFLLLFLLIIFSIYVHIPVLMK